MDVVTSRGIRWLCAFSLGLASFGAIANLCETGKKQSPIDITVSQPGRGGALQFGYRPQALKIANDGHTVRVRMASGSVLHIGPTRYALQQFHFHTPGGDRIGGEEFPMAAHLLHKSDSGQLLALVVLFRTGAENALLKTLLPLIPARSDGDHLHAGIVVSASALIPPKGDAAAQRYFRYSGSLTSAPCTEGVEWVVLKQPLELSVEQLRQYRAQFADNARAVQPLNGRAVTENP